MNRRGIANDVGMIKARGRNSGGPIIRLVSRCNGVCLIWREVVVRDILDLQISFGAGVGEGVPRIYLCA